MFASIPKPGLFWSVAAAIVPTLAYVILIWRIDRYEKEPLKLLAAAFLWGALPAVLLSAAVEVGFDAPIVALSRGYDRLVMSSLVAPPIEEALKALALLGLFLLARYEFDGVLDGIIYASLIGFGFAMTEDIFYFGNVQGDLSAWSTIVLGRTLAFGFSHAMFTSFTGVGFGLASYLRSRLGRVVVVLLGLLAAITTHLFHNFFLSAGDFCLVSFLLDWMGVGVIFVIILLAWWRERSWIKEHLADEVAAGVLTSSQLQDLVAWHRRLLRTWRALEDGGWRRARLWRKFAQAATELAFKKRQLATVGEGEKLEAAIVSARADVVRLGKELGGKPFTVEG